MPASTGHFACILSGILTSSSWTGILWAPSYKQPSLKAALLHHASFYCLWLVMFPSSLDPPWTQSPGFSSPALSLWLGVMSVITGMLCRPGGGGLRACAGHFKNPWFASFPAWGWERKEKRNFKRLNCMKMLLPQAFEKRLLSCIFHAAPGEEAQKTFPSTWKSKTLMKCCSQQLFTTELCGTLEVPLLKLRTQPGKGKKYCPHHLWIPAGY